MIGLEWLNSLAKLKGRGGQGLEHTSLVHTKLGCPGDSFKAFHVAGTNGKGSVSCFIAAVIGANGFKVGLYTSPHLEVVNERIVIDGEEINDQILNQACIEVRNASPELELSFFEAITLAAFIVFRDQKVDFGVIEVGIGGRLDSTNVLSRPLASVISTIDLDHENVLGETLKKIAVEKAGIIKQGTPVILGRMADEARARIVSLHSEVGGTARLYALDHDFTPNKDNWQIAGETFSLEIALPGRHQEDNLAVAHAAVYFGLNIAMESQACQTSWKNAFRLGAKQAYWPNRLESIVWRNKNVLIDCAHNPAGIQSLISFLDNSKAAGESRNDISFVFGAVETKRWEEMLSLLIPYAAEFHLVTPNPTDGVELCKMQSFLSKYAIKSIGYDNDAELMEGLTKANRQKIVCCGSIYLTGRLRKLFGVTMKPRWIRGDFVERV